KANDDASWPLSPFFRGRCRCFLGELSMRSGLGGVPLLLVVFRQGGVDRRSVRRLIQSEQQPVVAMLRTAQSRLQDADLAVQARVVGPIRQLLLANLPQPLLPAQKLVRPALLGFRLVGFPLAQQ